MLDFIASDLPAQVFVQFDDTAMVPAVSGRGRFTARGTEITLARQADGSLPVTVYSPATPLDRVVLRWSHPHPLPAEALFLGDHWERSYGDLQWRSMQPERVMPWYMLAHDRRTHRTSGAGVRVQPNAFCFWTIDPKGLSLWIDVRNGGSAVVLGDRPLAAATVVAGTSADNQSAHAFAGDFCRQMCPAPRLARQPVVGNNNWYYAYGRNFSADTIRRDGQFLAELAGDHPNRPFCVIDAGWSHGGGCPGGPWREGIADKFPDMPGLAADLRRMGVRPGIWMRPTALSTVHDPSLLRAGPQPVPEKALDLTLPEVRQLIHEDVQRVQSWGYELIKHDFSTYDAFARWGFEFGAEITDSGWNWHDRSKTNAEVLLDLYRTLRNAAGEDTVLIGCNTVGHLGAGLFEVQRIGDDTSGKHWERTRKMGINTLAFRLGQHNTFFAADADCTPHTAATPWELDQKFLELVARSGTPLFISVDPATISQEKRRSFEQAVRHALSGGDFAKGIEPLDWLTNTTPNHWRIGSENVEYAWTEPFGTAPFRYA